MACYRIFFRDISGMIYGREDFEADADGLALLMADMLFDACSDLCASFEVWEGSRMLDGAGQRPSLSPRLRRTIGEAVIECEVAIRDSHWPIASSRRLLEQTDRLRERLRRDSDDTRRTIM